MTQKLHQRSFEPSADDASASYDVIGAMGGYENMISQGAEGRVFEVTFLGRPAIVKQRFKKTYRHPILDGKLTKLRLLSESPRCCSRHQLVAAQQRQRQRQRTRQRQRR